MKYEARYWNTNGKGICVMAVITEGIDWAAYIGADNGYSESDCMSWTCEYGAKLSEEDARYFFPKEIYLETELPYRR